jgi:hypothetical protein
MKTLVYLLKEDSEETVAAIGLLQRLQGGMTPKLRICLLNAQCPMPNTQYPAVPTENNNESFPYYTNFWASVAGCFTSPGDGERTHRL